MSVTNSLKKRNENKRQYGLIGLPLKHTFSPKYFQNKFKKESIYDAEYHAFEIENIAHIFNLFEEGVLGLNVTIPYKEKVIPCLDKLDISASGIMAVNTIKNVNGKLIGYNTDVYGFQKSLAPFLKKISKKKALILGTGGASKAVRFVLEKEGFEVRFVSRSKGDFTYTKLTEKVIQSSSIIVNTTPLGTAPNIHECPAIPYQFISDEHLMYDLVYNPEKTVFLTRSESQGATIKNGYEMLTLQAEKSWSIWNTNQ